MPQQRELQTDSWTDVPSDEVLGAQVTIDETGDSESVFRQGVIGKMRYHRVVMRGTGTPNAFLGVVALLGDPQNAPVADQST